MSPIRILAVAGWLTLLVGCSGQAEDSAEPETTQSITGEVLYRERILLPPGA